MGLKASETESIVLIGICSWYLAASINDMPGFIFINGLVQECGISSALIMKIPQSCIPQSCV